MNSSLPRISLTAALAALLSLCLVAGSVAMASPVASSSSLAPSLEDSSSGQEAEQEKKKKKKKNKKQGGKVVKARVVSSPEPAPAEPITPPAPAPAPEPVEPAKAAAKPETAAETAAEPKAEPTAEPAKVKVAEPAPMPETKVPETKVPETKVTEPKVAAEPKVETRTKKAAPTPAPVAKATKPATVKPATPKPASSTAAPAAVTTRPRRSADRPRSASRRTPGDVVSERVLVSEVLLDVLVTNKKGDVIPGLGPEDFVVIEDGEEKEVTSVTFYGTADELRGSGVAGDARSDRYFILMFHDQAQAFPSLMAAQLDNGRRAKEWVQKELLPNDQVAVLGYDVRLKVYQDFSRDREALSTAILRAAAGKKEHDRGWREPEIPRSADSPSLFLNLPKDKELARQSRKLQQALALVGRASEGIVGRKNLMLFSVGFGDILDGGLWHPDPRYYPDMKESLNDGNVAVYAIDLLGSRGNPGARDINDALSSIASDTGGYYYSLFTNALTPLRQVTEDNLGYYMVSYRTQYERGTSGYREVEVDTRDKSYKVRGRKGYRYGSALPAASSSE